MPAVRHPSYTSSPVSVFTCTDNNNPDLRERGWVIPAYTMAPHSDKLKLMRVVVREDFSRSRCEALVKDMALAMKTLMETDAGALAHHDEISKRKKDESKSEGHKKVGEHYKSEKHSLQGKHGKSHPIC